MPENIIDEELDNSNKNVTNTKINDANNGERTFSDITPKAMILECEDTKHRDNNNNEAETNMVTLYKEIGKFPDSTYPDIMEECGNK